LYYLYNFWVFAVAGAYAFVAGSGVTLHGWKKGAALLGILVCIIFVGRNAVHLRQMTSGIARDHTTCRVLLESLDRYVQAHKQEPGFTFYMLPTVPGNFPIDWTTRRDDPPGKVYSLVELLYLPYFTKNNPRHFVRVR